MRIKKQEKQLVEVAFDIEVELTSEDLLARLAEEFKFGRELIEPNDNARAVLLEEKNGYFIAFESNMVPHGGMGFEEFSRRQLSKEEFDIAKGLKLAKEMLAKKNI